MENGFEGFFRMIAIFKDRINFRIETENKSEEVDTVMSKVVGLEQLSSFFTLYMVQIISAIAVFIAELVTYHQRAIRVEDEVAPIE